MTPRQRDWVAVAERFIASIPFGKIGKNQAFDLAFDIIAFGFIGFLALRINLGPHHAEYMVGLVVVVLVLAMWSFLLNRR